MAGKMTASTTAYAKHFHGMKFQDHYFSSGSDENTETREAREGQAPFRVSSARASQVYNFMEHFSETA